MKSGGQMSSHSPMVWWYREVNCEVVGVIYETQVGDKPLCLVQQTLQQSLQLWLTFSFVCLPNRVASHHVLVSSGAESPPATHADRSLNMTSSLRYQMFVKDKRSKVTVWFLYHRIFFRNKTCPIKELFILPRYFCLYRNNLFNLLSRIRR
jgi:hypothetical protein